MQQIVKPLLVWYEQNKRELPWREGSDPYHIWISEIMLQQTRVEAVKGYYSRFLERLPGLRDLAEVPEDELMKLWQGLGYYNRARNLQKAAQVIMQEYQGEFPQEYELLLELPGIGEYTAGAIASIAFGKRVPAVDGNVYRIYARLFADSSDIMAGKVRKRIRNEVARVVPENEAGAFNQALMDLGATVCIPNGQPFCEKCPIAQWCISRKQGDMLAYPVKPVKKPRKVEDRTVFLIEYQGRYLIQQRPKKGLLAGLWEFPSQEGSLSLEALRPRLEEWGADTAKVELLGKGKHIFSHIEWHMLGYLIHLKELPEVLENSFVLSSVGQLQEKYSIPSAFAVYMSEIMRRAEVLEESGQEKSRKK